MLLSIEQSNPGPSILHMLRQSFHLLVQSQSNLNLNLNPIQSNPINLVNKVKRRTLTNEALM